MRLLAEDTGQEKTEQATEKRREETRNKGQVARSLEINAAFMLLVSFSVLLILGGGIMGKIEDNIRGYMSLGLKFEITNDSVRNLCLTVIWQYFSILMPFFIILIIAGVLINVVQVGFLFTGEPLKPNLEKISPIAGMKRLFSRKTFESLLRDILKVVVVSWIGYVAVKDILDGLAGMSSASPAQIIAFTGSAVFGIAMKILIGYIIIAIFDYAFQRWDYEKSMMMTRQELRDELRQMEGDPMLKARIRSVQRELARHRMMEEVPKAEVVITNPTEIAIALSYEPGMAAPVVTAKGRHFLAEKIRNIASENGVPIVENVLLAQALYKAVDIGRPVPPELYTAVAEILAYVFRLKNKKAY